MATIREQIMERTRIARMRLGQQVGEPVTIPSMPEVRAALVPLVEKEIMSGMMRAAALEVPDNAPGMQIWNRTVRQSDVWNALREPDNLEQKVFHTVEEMTEALDPEDIDIIAEQLVLLMMNASTSLADMTDEDVANVKKVLARIEPRELSGRPAAALVLLLSEITEISLPVSSRSSTSTP